MDIYDRQADKQTNKDPSANLMSYKALESN